MDGGFPSSELVVDEILAAGFDAVMNEPKLAIARSLLTRKELRMIVASVTNATALIAARQLILGLQNGK